VADALAFAGPGVRREVISNPRQSEATQYGKLFSRAQRVQAGGVAELLVSGTAAVGPGGETLHPGDPTAQLADTVECVASLLEAGGMHWADVTGGIAYLHPAHCAALLAGLPGTALRGLPLALAPATVCRPDLLFELELSAARP
jgi:enamine deaminase RidA (YjgF/YER057c/UK114 family)